MKNHQAKPSLTETGYCKCGRPLDSVVHHEQPQHTQGELNIGVPYETRAGWECQIHQYDNFSIYIANGKTLEEAEANAQRIVKAVNMHDELIKTLKNVLDGFQKEDISIYEVSYQASLKKGFELLKQAKQK